MTVERRRMSRGRILQGAVEILDAGVYGDLTVDALARALHMSKSTLYKYFASKDDVVVALIEDACADAEDALEAMDVDRTDALGVVHALVDLLAEHADKIPRAAVLQEARLPTSCQDRMQLTRASVGEALQRALARGTRAGTFGYPDPVLAATTFMAGAEAAMRASSRGEIDGSRGDAVRALLRLYEPGLAPTRIDA